MAPNAAVTPCQRARMIFSPGYVIVNIASEYPTRCGRCQRLQCGEQLGRTNGVVDLNGRTPARVTVTDVARAAGVSTATVTRSLQESPLVTPATRERVIEAARRLGYTPNPTARDLRRGHRTAAVGLVTAGFTNMFQAGVAAGAERELRRAGLQLLTGSTEDDEAREPDLARTMVDRRVSALIMMPDGN